MLTPVGRVENSIHEIVRMAGKNVHVFVALVLGLQKIAVDTPASFRPALGFVHAVRSRDAFRKRLMHAGDDREHLRIGQIISQNFFEPADLQ